MLWALTAITIVGVILNIKKKRSGFIYLALTDIVWAVYNFYKDIPEQGILFIVFTGFMIYGWVKWGENGKI